MKIILTEAQKKWLIVGILMEQNVQPFTVDFGNTFSSGRYEFTPNYAGAVNEKIIQIVTYIKNKNLKNFKIVITPGESQVRNQINPETGVRFGVGELAQKRAEVLKGYLDKVLRASLSFQPNVEVTKPIIGQTPAGGDKNDPKYTAEQFVKVSVVITSVSDPKPQPFNKNADIGEGIYMNNFLIGYIQVPSRKTNSPTDPGSLNTGRQDVIFTEVKKDTQPPIPIGTYHIPFSWWNQRPNATTHTITPDELSYIRSNFKASS